MLDQVDIPFLVDGLFADWEEFPPDCELVPILLGFKPSEPKKKSNDLQDLLGALQGVPGLAIDPRIFEPPKGSA